MTSSLFPSSAPQQPTRGGSLFDLIGMARSAQGGPAAFAQQLMQTNPQFREFAERNQGKSPEQIARENGIDFNQVRGLFG